MMIFKMELIEGPELYYKNPFKKNDVAIGQDLESVKVNPYEKAWILKPEESVTFQARSIFIRVL